MLTVAVSTFLAMCIVELLAPAFSAFVGAELRVEYFGEQGIASALIGLVLLVGILAGSYPAFYLSAFEPARVLKGDVAGGTFNTHCTYSGRTAKYSNRQPNAIQIWGNHSDTRSARSPVR